MLTQTERSSPRLLVIAFAFVVVGMAGLAVRSTNVELSRATGTAAFTIDGATYEFTPSACTVTDTDFLTAGAGQLDGEDFWVSVSPEASEIAFGTADERIRSEDLGDTWYRNNGTIDWNVEGDTVEATLALRDERRPDAPIERAHFIATCPT